MASIGYNASVAASCTRWALRICEAAGRSTVTRYRCERVSEGYERPVDILAALAKGRRDVERYRLLGIEHGGRESASARVVSREPNKWGLPPHTFNSGMKWFCCRRPGDHCGVAGASRTSGTASCTTSPGDITAATNARRPCTPSSTTEQRTHPTHGGVRGGEGQSRQST